MENIRIIFVLPEKFSDESEASEIMLQAFEACRQNISTNVNWMKESEFDLSTLNKTDFVVFDEFVGRCYEELKTTKCARILGPWAVSICLMEGKAIPNFPWPIYNVAMYDCIVTSSHLSKNIKMEIKQKVEMMGGCYVDTLVAKNTHLVTGSAKSEKYLAAAEAGVKLMCPSWVDDVWKVSQSVNVHANDDRFKEHYCLPFQNLTICSTGLSNAVERQKIEKLVKKNGGTFTGKLNLSNTDILICCGEGSTVSEKYKAARQYPHIKCVNLSWVTDSVAKGYALPHNQYQVQKVTSTPTKSDERVNPEFSVLSAIGGPNMSQRAWVEETLATPFSPGGEKFSGEKRKSKEDFEELVENIDIKKAKKAGQYLDGCSVYVTGFSSEHTEKLNKVLNLSGATRYETFTHRVTHVIVGDPSFREVKVIKEKGYSSLLVSIRWLIDSIEQAHPMNEDKYLVNNISSETSHLGSPLGKKGLNMLLSDRTITEREMEKNLGNSNNTEDKLDDLVRQYMKPMNASSQEDTLAKLLEGAENTNFSKRIEEPPKTTTDFNPPDTSTQQSTMSVTQDEESEESKIFENFRFLIIGFDDEEYDELKSKIEDFSGELVPKTYKGVPDYIVVPVFNKSEVHHAASEIVNDLFVCDCIREEALLPDILYYHRPFDVPDAKPLENCVITISSYTGSERVFLKGLIEALGGVSQEQFARVKSDAKGVAASTHLVSAEATGKKYEAALKWGLPVLSKEWLLDCAKAGKLVHEGDYLLGTSKAPERPAASPQVVRSLQTSFENVAKDSTPSSSRPSSRLSRVLTPANHLTPAYKRFLDSAEKPFSQVTPVNKIMKHFRESNLNSSLPKEKKEYILPQPWMNIKTPETPLGACMTPDPSPGLRKQCEYWLQQFPDKESPKSNVSTPLSEIKRQLWNKVLKRTGQALDFSQSKDEPQSEEQMDAEDSVEVSSSQGVDKTPENPQLASRLQQLEEMLSASGGGRRQSRNFQSTVPVPVRSAEYKDSQPCTVGWDFTEQEEPPKQAKIFAISGIADDEARANMVQHLEKLGALVSSLTNYDPTCTHLLCPKPARNEKSLSCMAAGKWVLHISYLEKSVEAGRFLDEEEFEFGNPKSAGKFGTSQDRDTDYRIQRMHWWRKEISRRGYGAFNDMRAIVVAAKREPIVRVIEAGGGVVIDVKPPFDDPVHATHCLLELKSVENVAEYIPLARQGIYLVNTVYISDYLHQPNRDIRDCVLPYFSKFYARS